MAERCYRVNVDFLNKRAPGWGWKRFQKGTDWHYIGSLENKTVVVFQRITRAASCDYDSVWLVKTESLEESLELWLAKQK